MKKDVREKVLNFIQNRDTSELSSNEFIWDFIEYEAWFNYWNWITMTRDLFCKIVSVESITRSRRKVIADHWIGKRTKADKEIDYITEFGRQNKF